MLRYAYVSGHDMLATERADGRSVLRAWVVLSAYLARRALLPLSSARHATGVRVTELAPSLALGAADNTAAWIGTTAALFTR